MGRLRDVLLSLPVLLKVERGMRMEDIVKVVVIGVLTVVIAALKQDNGKDS